MELLSLLLVVCLLDVVPLNAMDPTNKMDFVGNGQADIVIYREGCDRITVPAILCSSYTQSYFWIRDSETGAVSAFPYGRSLDFPVPADYTGDGKTDYAVYRWFQPNEAPNDTNAWFINGSPTNFFGNVYGRKAPRNFSGPTPDTAPTAELAELRRDLISTKPYRYSYTFYWQTGQSFVSTSTGIDTEAYKVTQFAVPQDYIGEDQKSEVAVLELRKNPDTQAPISSCYRVWQNPTTQNSDVCLDNAVNLPAPGDYDGNGLADYGGVIDNGTNLVWKVKHNLVSGDPPAPDLSVTFGPSGAKPVPADYTGDGKTDMAYAAVNGNNWEWFIKPSNGDPVYSVSFGLKSDTLISQPYFSDPWY